MLVLLANAVFIGAGAIETVKVETDGVFLCGKMKAMRLKMLRNLPIAVKIEAKRQPPWRPKRY
ncbi:hypothetical protein ACERZ8_15525 [Tateyamaria armeniaca]|uniref:Uncharacterized protein n=1 Tax=Tateyamaria armeniaca TaxID=2518930 RepID=A0ABW8UZ70_9RHOB